MSTSTVTEFVTAESYAAMTRAEKAAARSAVEHVMRSALDEGNFDLAQSAHQWLKSVPGSSATRERTEIDYTRALAERIATLRTIAHLLASGESVPDGVESSMIDYDRLHSILEEDSEDLVDLDAAQLEATKRVTRRTERNDIQSVVDRAFADVPSGTFLSIAKVAVRGKHPRGVGASGAIAARVDWDTLECSLDGVEPVERTATSPRGFRKL